MAELADLEGAEPAARSESALAENIREKGSNAYYYAHGSRAGEEKVEWDGKEEPRFLRREKIASEEQKSAKLRQEIQSYGWYDDGKKVKVIVDFEAVEDLEEEAVRVEVTDRSLKLYIEMEDKMHQLSLSPLFADVEAATLKRKNGKAWITLKKVGDEDWDALLEKEES